MGAREVFGRKGEGVMVKTTVAHCTRNWNRGVEPNRKPKSNSKGRGRDHKPENHGGTRIQKPDTKTGVEPKQKLKAEVEPKKRNLETGKTGTPGERRNYF